MKIKITFFATSLLLLGSITNIRAQNWLTAGNGLTGGTSSTPTEWLGSNNLYDLIIKTNNTQRMRVISGGHVLIGSGTVATYPLTLNDYTNAGTLNTGGNFAVSFHSIVGGAAIGSQDINNHAVFGVTGSTSDMLFATYNGSSFDERVRIMNGGNVGIGTTSPDIWGGGTDYRTLTILGPNTSSGSSGIIELATQSTDANANKAGAINFIASANASGKRSIAQIYSFTQGSTATNRGGYLAFSTKPDNATSDVERMRIDNVGNVGIGTSTPASKLDVEGGISIGATYSGTTAAPANGAIIEGSVGIGLTNPSKKLNLESAGTNDGILVKQTSTTAASLYLNASTGHQWALFSKGTGNGAAGDFSIYNLTSGGDRFYIKGSTGFVGIGTTAPGYKLDVQGGDINASGSVRSAGVPLTSDQMFKTDIDSLQNALAVIKQLKAKSYYFDTVNYNGEGKFNFPTEKQYGFIAQEIQNILPDLVSFATKAAIVDSLGNIVKPAYTYRSLNYIGIIPFLTKGIQELQFKNDSLQTKANKQDSVNTSLQNQMNQLMTSLNNCCTSSQSLIDNSNNGNTKSMNIGTILQGETAQMDVQLNDGQSVILEQNVPNPFQEQTVVNYTLPDNTVKAQMLFYNAQGKLIKSVELVQKGKGQLNVFASDLTNGIYTYSLIVDGQIIDTKKMVKSK